MRRSLVVRFLAFLCLLGLSLFAAAQTDTARIVGTITDASGAAISGATVTVTSQATARAHTTTTGATGNYVVPALPPGRYTVQVQQANFASAVADVTLEVSQVQEVSLKLKPGNVSETVNVTDEVPLVETATSSTGEVIQGRQVTELPLNGRNFTQLALLTPGVTRGAYGDAAMGGSQGTSSENFRNSETGGAALSANGLRPQANNFILDGVDNNESLVNSIVFFPPAEAIQEFRVNTSVAPAEFGRAGGAIVQTTIKGGSNAFHGSAFWFRRSGDLQASPYGATEKPPFKRNQFGGTLGGPIWKNKLFFFLDYQGLRQNAPQSIELATVPTALMRTGDFSELLTYRNASGNLVPTVPSCALSNPAYYAGLDAKGNPISKGYIFDPRTCTPFPGNIIPQGIANAAGLNYLNAFPLPNNNNAILQNFSAQRQQLRNFDDFDARVDYVLSAKDAVFARFSYGQDGFSVTDRLRDATHDLPSGFGSGNNYNHPRGASVGYTRAFSSAVVNEFRFGFTRPAFGYNPPFQGVPLAANLGIANANRSALLGGIALIGGSNNELEYTGDYGPYSVPEHTYQFLDSVSINFGKHSVKTGFNVIRRHVDFFQGNAAKGSFVIGGTDYPGTGRFTGYEVSELLAGFPDYQLGSADTYYKTRNWETGYFIQDDYRLNDRLTLNFGLRYDLYTWPEEINNRQSNFDFATQTLVRPGTAGYPKSLINTDKNNWAPRLGFAWDIYGSGKTVLRGGYGIFYFLDRGGVGNQLSNNADFNGTTTYHACPNASIAGAAMCPSSATNPAYRITLSGQGPAGNNDWTAATGALPSPVNAVNPTNLAATPGINVISYPQQSQNSMVQQWNLQLENSLGRNTVLDIAYVGTSMDNLATVYNANSVPLGAANNSTRLFPNLGTVTVYDYIGSGNYHGLQTRLNHRMSQGLQVTAAYTWSHTLDDSAGPFNNSGGTILVDASGRPRLDLNYGNSDADIRHFFTFSSLYELPWGRGKRWGGDMPKALDLLVGGWQWNNILTFGTGTPFSITVPGTPGVRPDVVGDYQFHPSGKTWLTPASAFAAPPLVNGVYVRQGTLAKNFFHGPGVHTWDMSLFKDFRITERFTTQFRAELYNVTNTPAFQNPSGDTNSNQFGQLVTARFSSERQAQLALRVMF